MGHKNSTTGKGISTVLTPQNLAKNLIKVQYNIFDIMHRI